VLRWLFVRQVTELTPEETENPLGGYGRTISHVIIGLKTTKGSKQLRLDPSIYDALQKEKVHGLLVWPRSLRCPTTNDSPTTVLPHPA
jgi:hypothetical protein